MANQLRINDFVWSNRESTKNEPRAIEMKRYDLKANYDFCLKIYKETGNVNYFNKAQAIKRKVEQFRQMDIFIERADRLNGVV